MGERTGSRVLRRLWSYVTVYAVDLIIYVGSSSADVVMCPEQMRDGEVLLVRLVLPFDDRKGYLRASLARKKQIYSDRLV